MKKKMIVAVTAVMLLGIGTSAAADTFNYKFHINNPDIPYNTTYPAMKYSGSRYATVKVDEIRNDILPDWFKKRITNFMIAKGGGAQISTNVKVPESEQHTMGYFDNTFQDNVFLLANSTETGILYTVSGTWNPSVN